ncbi:hypothetical protein A0H81_12246 [Grifola frondosa]|uniref:Uncharacterized protein n=1 Tax=Grifola frondosa TaxID=5627 RepID=A0A1C7LRZ4_GRIFR|nr:hypothetical protein A0H81_12246 [Grifola frondosa]
MSTIPPSSLPPGDTPSSIIGGTTSNRTTTLVFGFVMAFVAVFGLFVLGVMISHRRAANRRALHQAAAGGGDVVEKPQMWDTLVGDKAGGLALEKCGWERIHPLALEVTPDSISSLPRDGGEEGEATTGAGGHQNTRCGRRSHHACCSRKRAHNAEPEEDPRLRAHHARVAVLISMPSRPSSSPRALRLGNEGRMATRELCQYASPPPQVPPRRRIQKSRMCGPFARGFTMLPMSSSCKAQVPHPSVCAHGVLKLRRPERTARRPTYPHPAHDPEAAPLAPPQPYPYRTHSSLPSSALNPGAAPHVRFPPKQRTQAPGGKPIWLIFPACELEA